MKFSQLLAKCELSPKLIFLLESAYRRMLGQIRQSLGRLSGMTTAEINRLFMCANLEPSDFDEVLKEYPKNVYVMQHPVYSLLTLIMLKCYQEGNQRLALDVNTLLGLAILGRRKYKYIRFVDQDIFDKTIATISKKTYIGMHGVIWMVNNVTKTTHDRYIQQMLNNVDDVYPRYRYIDDIYNRFNQIMKVIAVYYYKNMEHRNDVPRSVVVKNRANEILDFLMEKPLPENLIEYIAKCSNSTTDRINQLYHNIQTYTSMQSQLQLIITFILDRILSFFDIMREQLPEVKVDINEPNFINLFVNKLKRSTIVLRAVSDAIFSQYGHDRFEVLYFALIITLYVDSMNHYQDYYGSGEQPNQQSTIEDEPYDEFENSVDTYEENLEALFDGVILDESFFLE